MVDLHVRDVYQQYPCGIGAGAGHGSGRAGRDWQGTGAEHWGAVRGRGRLVHEVEPAVLYEIGSGGWRHIETVRGAPDETGVSTRSRELTAAWGGLARAPTELLAALVASGPPPPGFIPVRVRVQADAPLAKRCQRVARLRPHLVEAALSTYAWHIAAGPPGSRPTLKRSPALCRHRPARDLHRLTPPRPGRAAGTIKLNRRRSP
jgi:hypothetical protein